MVSNIEKVTQRGDKLDDLGERAGLLVWDLGVGVCINWGALNHASHTSSAPQLMSCIL